MKYCSNCGQPLREGVKVCTNCGKPVHNLNQITLTHSKIITTKVDKISMSNINIKGIITIIKTVMPTDMINNHVKAIIKDLDYYCSYSCIANCFDRCIFSIKNQFSPEKQASNIAQAIKKDDEKH